MNEGEIRQAAQMYALVAEMHGVVASVEGMKADNAEREAAGLAQAWPGGVFDDARQELENIAKLLRDTI